MAPTFRSLSMQFFMSLLFGFSASVMAADAPSAPKVLPPGIDDVLAEVRRSAGDTRAADAAKQLMGQEIPATASIDEQIAFLTRRASAADEVGDLSQRLADLKRIAELSRGARNEDLQFYNLGLAEVVYGDAREGQAALQHVLGLLEKTYQNAGLQINSYSILAYTHVVMGRQADASEMLAKARWLLGQLKARPGGAAGFIPSFEMMTNFAEGRLLVARGKWNEADAVLRQAVAKGEETARNLDKLLGTSPNNALQTNLLAGRNLVVAELAQHLMRMGRLDEAELLIRDMLSINLQRVGRNSVRSAVMLIQLADLTGERGRYREALRLLDEVEAIGLAMGIGEANRIALSLRQSRLNALIGLEDWKAAVDAEMTFRRSVDAKQGLSGIDIFSPGLGIGLVQQGKAGEARGRLDSFIARLTEAMGADHYQVAEARGVRAMAMAALGDRQAALAEFAVASRVLIERSARDEEALARNLRAMVRRHILESYLDVLANSPDLGNRADLAFRIADALHAGKTQQALADSAVRVSARQSGLGDLVRQEQDSKAEQVSLYRELLRLSGLPADRQLPKVMADMRQRIGDIDRERREREVTIEQRFPAYANLIRPRPPTMAEARAVLKPGEALINVLSTGSASYVWAFKAGGEVGFVRVPMGSEAIAKTVASLRKAVDPGEFDPVRGLPGFDATAAHRLYAALLAPVADAWKGADSLLVVANGALGQLPLALLPTSATPIGPDGTVRYAGYRAVPWLIREAALTQLPSVNALVTLRKLPEGSAQRQAFIGFGDPDFSAGSIASTTKTRSLRSLVPSRFRASTAPAAWLPYSDIPALPDTRDEILALAKVLKADPARDVFLGDQASKARLLQMDLSKSRILAFATHGLLPGEFPGVNQPSLALANPGGGQHGLLTLDDILGLKLDADWVILSACNTAAGEGSGAEAVSGLGRGFFYAGTRALLATHWPVESVSARLLVTGTFASQAANPSLSRAQALRQSMLALMETNATEGGFAYAHPLFWAPYALIGDGGR